MFSVLAFVFLLHNFYYVAAQEAIVAGNLTLVKRCPDNQVYDYNCDYPCQETCGNYYLKNKFCEKPCANQYTCVCAYGYVYSSVLGACIKPQQCPKEEVVCPANQEYVPGLYVQIHCPRVLSNFTDLAVAKEQGIDIASLLLPVINQCVIDFTPGCRCKSGFVLHEITGNCYNPNIDVACIDKNAYYDPCGGYCTYTSCYGFGVCYVYDECIPACICYERFVYNERQRRCTSLAECGSIVVPWLDDKIFIVG